MKKFLSRRKPGISPAVSGGISSGDKVSGLGLKFDAWEGILLCVVLLFVVFVRIRLLGFPLERDEGEYAYMGQLILQGIPPYQLAYNMKFPGIYALYAVFEGLFGQTVYGVHLGLLWANVAAIILLFFLCKKLISGMAAIIASATYAFLSLSSSVLGFAAHATQFIVPFVMAGFLLLLKACERQRAKLFFLAGILFGSAVLVKQSALPFCLWGLGVIALKGWHGQGGRGRKILSLAAFSAGVLTPLAATFVALYAMGVFEKFWFWTVTYMRTYAAQVSFGNGIDLFREAFSYVVDGFVVLWITAGLGFCAVCVHPGLQGKKGMILSFAFFSFMSVSLGFYFRWHYFVVLLPAVSILTGIFFDYLCLRGTCRKTLVLLLFLAVAGGGLAAQARYFFWDEPVKLSRKIYGGNPFPESWEIAKLLQAVTRPEESIAILGSEPQIYFYAKRHSSTGYIYMYGLMEKQEYGLVMQKEMVREIEAANPRFIVFVACTTSWQRQLGANHYIFDWWAGLLRENKYQKVGVADIFRDKTIYRLGAEMNDYEATSSSQVLIYKRAEI